MLRKLLWMVVGAIIAVPIAFTQGINFERDATHVCYAASEDSTDLHGCHYEHHQWFRDPVTTDDILSGYRR